MTNYDYSIKLTANYDGKSHEGLYAGRSQHGVIQLDWMTESGEANYYAKLETAQSVALSINGGGSEWKAVVLDAEGKLVA